MRALLTFLLLTLPLLHAAGMPYVEVARIYPHVHGGSEIKQLAISKDCLALALNDSLLLIHASKVEKLNLTPKGIFSGEKIFIQSEGRLYAFSKNGLDLIADCGSCTYVPYSREKYAIVSERGLVIRVNGKEKTLGIKPISVKWSEDGSYLAVLEGNSVSLIKEGELLWSSGFNTQIFDLSVNDGVLAVTTKNCEVYAYRVKGGIAWTNRICDCCIPLKLASTDGIFAVAILGKEIAILNSTSGKVLQRSDIPAYRVWAFEGLITALDSNGTVHVLADANSLRVEGKSSGILLEWGIPEWVKGELRYEVGDEIGSLTISTKSFLPVKAKGNLTLKLRDPNGVEIERIVEIKPLIVDLKPDGEVSIEGEGELAIESGGSFYRGTHARVDTGFLPTYSITVLNYGVPIARYECYNSRFTLITLILALSVVIALVKKFLFKKAQSSLWI
mgnify:CR=1 FL=1